MDFLRLLEAEAPNYQVEISPAALHSCRIYFELLQQWREVVNLTAISDPLELARFHFLESMHGASFLPSSLSSHYDLGSGAGFPAIPIKLLRPDLDLTLFESRQRKSAFLKEAVRQLDMTRVSIRSERVNGPLLQQWACPMIVTFRALAFPDHVMIRICHQLSPGGRLIQWHSSNQRLEQVSKGHQKMRHVISEKLPFSRDRYISVYEKSPS